MRTFKNFSTLSMSLAFLATTLGAGAASAATGRYTFNGGQVVTQPKVEMVYVGDWDNSPASLNAQATIERFITSIGGTKYFGTLSGYTDRNNNPIQNAPIPIVGRVYDPDMTSPMDAGRVNEWLKPIVSRLDANTIVVQVPSSGIGKKNNGLSCGGGTNPFGCNGNFKQAYVDASGNRYGYPVATALMPMWDSNGHLSLSWSANWFHELVEAITSSDGLGWNVIDDTTGADYQLGDVCDYDTPWRLGTVTIRTTWQNDAFLNAGVPVRQMNPNGVTMCSHAYTESAEIFGVGYSPYHLFHQHLSAAAGASVSHSGWNDLGTLGASGFLNGGPGVASWGPGRMDFFNFDSYMNLRHGYFDSGVSSCSSESGTPCVDNWGAPPAGWTFTAEPAVTSQGMGRLDLFAVGTSGSQSALFQRTWDSGSDTGWVNRGNPGVALAGGATAASFGPGHVDAFAIGADNSVYHGAWDGSSFSWSRWIGAQAFNGSTLKWQGHPAATSWAPGSFHIMLLDTSGRLFDCGGDNYTAWGGCGGWASPSGVTLTNSPAITNLGDDRLIISARGSDGQDWMMQWDNGFSNWVPTGGGLAGASPGLGSF